MLDPLAKRRPAAAVTEAAAKKAATAAAKRAAKEERNAARIESATMKRPASAPIGEAAVTSGETDLSPGVEVLANGYRDEMKSRRWKSLFDGGLLPTEVTEKYAEFESAGPGGVAFIKV